MKRTRKIFFIVLSIITAFCMSMCIGCSCNDEEETVCVHEWGEWVSNYDGTHTRVCKLDASHYQTENCSGKNSKDATCLNDGFVDFDCPVCGFKAHNIISAFGHDWDNDLTCEEGHKCLREGCEACEGALSHDYFLLNSIPLSCETDGKEIYKCRNCGDTYEVIKTYATGHDYSHVEWGEPQKKEGCNYEIKGICPVCREEVTDQVVIHKFTTIEITTPATCKTKGIKTLTCDCGYQETEEYTNANAHVWGTPVNDGTFDVYTCTCSGCNEQKKVLNKSSSISAEVSKSDLSGSELKLQKASIALDTATLDALGTNVSISADTVEKDSLPVDDITKSKIGDKPVYDFSMSSDGGTVSTFGGSVTIRVPYTLEEGEDPDAVAIWYINDSGEVETIEGKYINGEVEFITTHFSYYTVTRLTPQERCALYGHIETETVVDPTCSTQGYTLTVCTRCGKYEKVYTPALGHDIQEVNPISATCVKNGEITKKCSRCELQYKEVIKALGHNYELKDSKNSTCQEEGYNKYKCSRCDAEKVEILKMTKHTFVDEVIEPTDTQDGYTKHTCSVCGYTYNDNFISKQDKDDIVKRSVITPVFESIMNKNFAIKLNNVHIKVDDEFEATANELQIKLDIASDGTINGYAVLDLEGNALMYIDKDISAEFPIQLSVVAIIENNVAYAHFEGDITSSYNNGYYYDGIERNGRTFENEYENGYVKIDLNKIDFCTEELPFSNYSELVDFVKGIKADYDEDLKETISNIKFLQKNTYYQFTETFLGWFFDVTKTTNGYVLTCNVDKLNSTVNMFKEKSISELVDSLFGKDTFANLDSKINEVLDTTIGDILDALEEKGITIDYVEELLEKYLPEEVFEEIDFEEIRATLENEEFLNTTIEEILLSISGSGNEGGYIEDVEVYSAEEQIEQEEPSIRDMIKEALDGIKDCTIFDLICNSEEERENIYSKIDEILDFVQFEINVYADNSKNIESIEVSASAQNIFEGGFELVFSSDYDYSSKLAEIKQEFDKIDLDVIRDAFIEEYDASYNEQDNTMIINGDINPYGYYRDYYRSLTTKEGEWVELRLREMTHITKVYLDNIMIADLESCGDKHEISINALCDQQKVYSVMLEQYGWQLTYEDLLEMFDVEELERADISSKYLDTDYVIGFEHKDYEADDIIYDINSKEVSFDWEDGEHVFTEEIISKAVGCAGVGEIKYTCTKCGYSYVKKYVNGHGKITYTFEMQGESCSNGVTCIGRCGYCDKEVERFTTDYHDERIVKIFDVSSDEKNPCGVYIRSCACGQYFYIDYYGDGDWDYTKENDNRIYYFRNGRNIYITSTYTPIEGETCKIRMIIKAYFDYNEETKAYSKLEVYDVTQYNHDTRRYVKLQDGAITCEDGVIVTEKCLKCGKTIQEKTTEYHESGIVEEIDLSGYGCACGGKFLIYGCACGAQDQDYKSREPQYYGNCEFDSNTIYYHGSFDRLIVYTCSVTDPECGFRYAVKYSQNTDPASEDCCTVYKEYFVGCDVNGEGGEHIYTYSYEDHNYTWRDVDDNPDDCEYIREEYCYRCGKVFDYYTRTNHSYGETTYTQGATACEIICSSICEKCGDVHTWKDYNHTYNTVTREIGDCYVEYYEVCSVCGYERYLRSGYWHNYEYLYPTCTQFGTATCTKCGDMHYINPVEHSWIYDETSGLYYCAYCGLENINGASGDVVLEDLSYLSGDGDTVVIGYYLRKYGIDNQNYSNRFSVALSLIEKGDQYAEPIVITLGVNDGIDIYNRNCVYFSMADVSAEAQELGYSLDDYDVRVSFVPLSGFGSNLEYAITIASDMADHRINLNLHTGTASFSTINFNDGNRNITLIEINLDSAKTVVFTSLSDNDTYGYIFDENKNVIYSNDDDGYGSNFFLKVKLSGGKYYLGVANYYSDNISAIPYYYSILGI